jgi:NDP-sugar pyrophosphorylase family protein
MKVIIPMSGLGERFIQAGFKEPKPLIEVHGKPIIEYVIKLFPGSHDFVFVCRDTHLKETKMRDVLRQLEPNGEIVSIEGHKLGPVYAVSKIFDKISDSEPVMISYCDYYMVWNFEKFLADIKAGGFDAGIPSYVGFHPHLVHEKNFYAGCKVADDGTLLEIREKFSFTANKMDTPQSAGCYYFQQGRHVKKYFSEALENNIVVNGEFYVSMIYNLLVRDGLKTLVYTDIPYFCQWGTPDDLKEYLYWSKIFQA